MLEHKKKAVILHKPSGSIAIVGNLSLIQKKFYNLFLYNAQEFYKKDKSTTWLEITLSELKKILKRDESGKDNNYLKKIIKDLIDIKVEYNYLNKDYIIEGISTLLNNIEFRKHEKTGAIIVKYTLPEIVREAMLGIIEGHKNSLYGKIDLIVIKGISKKHAITLYEICKDYIDVDIPELSLDDFRKLFGLENKYKKVFDLKKKVLDPACKELNDNPNVEFCVSYELIKRYGNLYSYIKFYVKSKNSQNIAEDDIDLEILDLLILVPPQYRKKISIKELLVKYLKKCGFKYCQRNILYTNQHAKKNYHIFLKRSLEEDWGIDWWEDTTNNRQNILDKIRNVKIKIGNKIIETNSEGFAFIGDNVLPPGKIIELIQNKKAIVIDK